jgi:hypothetical protein
MKRIILVFWKVFALYCGLIAVDLIASVLSATGMLHAGEGRAHGQTLDLARLSGGNLRGVHYSGM